MDVGTDEASWYRCDGGIWEIGNVDLCVCEYSNYSTFAAVGCSDEYDLSCTGWRYVKDVSVFSDGFFGAGFS